MRTETWYVMEDGSVGDPREIAPGTDGMLRHKDGRAVAYAPHGPRSRSVDTDAPDAGKSAPSDNTGASAPTPHQPQSRRETDETRDAVEIPENWRELKWPQLASLASKVSPDPISGKDSAIEAIESALQRRSMNPATDGRGYVTRESTAN